MQQYTKQHTKDWSALIEGSDAFVFVTPEYNFSPPAALKNALDYLYHEWEHKPVGFVSYGGTFGGVRSVQMLKQIVTSFNMMPIYEAVNIQMVSSRIKEGDKFESDEKLEQLCQTMLNKLAIWAKHLREMRKELNSSPKA
jgi:NAD(P)H-dependent FMN reductase